MTKAPQFKPMQPKVVLAVGAHPDDMDFGAAGTLAAFASAGAEIHYLQLTDGGSGSSDPDSDCQNITKCRQEEQRKACDIIGGTAVHFLNYKDGYLENSLDLKRDIVRCIRSIKPDTVITMDPSVLYTVQMGMVNHPDHRAAGQATLDAVYPLARDHLSLPELYEEGLQPHKVATLLLINLNQQNYYVNTTASHATKLKAVNAHASQIPDKKTIETLFTNLAEQMGEQAGYKYAEGFMRIDIQP